MEKDWVTEYKVVIKTHGTLGHASNSEKLRRELYLLYRDRVTLEMVDVRESES